MGKRSKKYTEAVSKIEKGKVYTKEEAVKLVKETSTSSFDGSVEVAMRLNLDTKKADQQLRGAIVLPKGTGKTKKVLVIAKGEKANQAKEAGADYVGDVDMLEKIEKENWFEFDTMIAAYILNYNVKDDIAYISNQLGYKIPFVTEIKKEESNNNKVQVLNDVIKDYTYNPEKQNERYKFFNYNNELLNEEKYIIQ